MSKLFDAFLHSENNKVIITKFESMDAAVLSEMRIKHYR